MQESNHLNVAIEAYLSRTTLGASAASLVHRLHQTQIPIRRRMVWLHISHGSAGNQRGGDSVVPHVARLHSEHTHQLLLQPRPISALLPACRSEEHTSELQSLMRISYAVFCLKKKNT